MADLKNYVLKKYRDVAEKFLGVLKDSKFYSHGYLTPTEFVIAGDQLCEKCLTWRYFLLKI